ncbi:MAG: response regulator [Deltaproteobacteria bacterium]|nr:response regulator [Deltaproteobacteria bacterium]
MNAFSLRHLRISTKIMVLGLAVSLVTLVLAGIVLASYQYKLLRDDEVRKLSVVADVLAADLSTAIAFQDSEGASDTLESLRVMDDVVYALIIDEEARVFARFGAPTPEDVTLASRGLPLGIEVSGIDVTVVKPIALQAKSLGTLVVHYHMSAVWSRLINYCMMFLLFFGVATVIALLLSSRLQALISQPILDLASLASRISLTKDYSLRATPTSQDEVGTLIEGVNEMLSQIQLRDQELQQHRDDLERQVHERTKQLAELVESLREAKEVAEAASLAKSTFLANMSHEIRTPLNGIIGLSQMLAESDIGPEEKADLRTIIECSDSLAKIINDILDFSKIEAGKLALDPHEMSLSSLLAQLVSLLQVQAKAKDIDITVDIAPNVPSLIIADSLRLRQILTNLIGNAIKFTRENGKIVLSASGSALETGEVMLQLSVADTGIGIPEDKQKLIFEAFSQADNSTTREFGGTGLGLAICARLVAMMGGKIWVESEPTTGSTFSFDIRCKPVEQQMESQKPSTSESVAVDSPTSLPSLSLSRPLQILLAEDNRVNQDVISRILKQSGHVVTLAPNGRIAIEKLATESFDIVLMDLHMPEMGGIEATQRIRAAADSGYATVPIIALTAHALSGVDKECLDAGRTDTSANRLSTESSSHL